MAMTQTMVSTIPEQISEQHFMEYYDNFDTTINLRLVILSCLKGNIGELWKLQVTKDSYALLLVTDFMAALVGDSTADPPVYANLFDKIKRHTMIFADNDQWISLVKSHFGFRFVTRKNLRYSFNEQVLDLNYLYDLRSRYVRKYDYTGIEFRQIQPNDYDNVSEYLFGYFEMFTDKETLTHSSLLHVAVGEQGQILAIAGTSDSPISGHYEVQIATEQDARKRGLGMMVSITHLIYALENGYWPHWDAASKLSADLADKLGYGDRTPYDVYFHTTKLIKVLRMSRIPKLIVMILRKFGKLQD